MSDPRVTVELLARADLSVKATLDEAWGKQWQEVLNDTGFGKVTLANDDANLALVEYGDYLRFSLDGVNRFISIVETMERNQIDQSEEVDEATVLGGRGSLAVFENAIVFPDWSIDQQPINDTFTFSFAALSNVGNGPDFQTGGLAYDMGTITAVGIPTNIPDGFVHWVAPSAPNGAGTHPLGDWYFFNIFCVPNGLYRIFIAGDDGMDIWLDDTPLIKRDIGTYNEAVTVDVVLTSFCHGLAGRINNESHPDPNPTRVVFAVYPILPDGTLDTIAAWSDPTYVDLFTWDFPAEPPAPYPGGIVVDLIASAQSNGWDDPIVEDFDSSLDSDGNAWPDRTEFTVQIGTDLLTVLKQLAETWFDMRMDPTTLTLHLYATPIGAVSGVSYVEATSITDLKLSGSA